MPTVRFNQAFVDSLIDPDPRWQKALSRWRSEDPRKRRDKAPQRVEIWDDLLPGFGLFVRPTGKAGFMTFRRLDGRQIRDQLGSFDAYVQDGKVDIACVREEARESLSKIRKGINPVVEKAEKQKSKETTLGTVLRDYLDHRPKLNKRGRPLAVEYLAEIRRALEHDVISTDLGAKPFAAIKSADLKALLNDMAQERPSHARHVYLYLRTAAAWLVDERDQTNFMAGIKPPAPATDRRRALEKDYELRLYWEGCECLGWPFGPLFRLVLLLGPRRDELAESTWDEFDLRKGIWSPGKAKNGRPITVHLSDLAIDILQALPRLRSKAGWVFPQARQRRSKAPLTDNPISGAGNALIRLRRIVDKLADEQGLPRVEHFTLHDQRRTIATGMANLDPPVDALVIDKILNHSTGGSTMSIVAKIYNRAEYLKERREALDRWSAHIEQLVGIQRAPAIVRLRS